MPPPSPSSPCPPSPTPAPSSAPYASRAKTLREGLARLEELRDRVLREGACALEGVSLREDLIIPKFEAAAAAGVISEANLTFLRDGLRFGFKAGVNEASPHLLGRRRFRNYPSATGNRAAVSAGLRQRVRGGKTVCLGPYVHARDQHVLGEALGEYRIFPLGSADKPNEPGVARGTSDHTRSGLNPASDLECLRHLQKYFHLF